MKILIATGASGGHIFPALELAKELKSMGHGIFFVSTRGHMENEIKGEGFDIFFSRSSFEIFLDILRMLNVTNWCCYLIEVSMDSKSV